ncbi:MAG: DNA polymerase III subunit alpha [Phycisphaerae bacterium]|nr:DNA polymerase III subunit alpha [Phycisphaerae bacterium]
MDGFVHLHVHSNYSLLDGTIRIEDLVAAAADQGSGAVALTDHGNLFGAVAFYEAARAAGIKPILGMEAYISPTTRDDRSMGNPHTAAYHLILLAMNAAGWRNLMKLSSRAYLEGFYYKPRVDRKLLAEFSEGLICTTACLSGEVPAALLAGQARQARRIAGDYRDIFGPERFFIEVQRQGLADQEQANGELIALAEELGVGLVATNDVHFLRREDKPAHEVLTAISTGKTLSEGGGLNYPPELYLKPPDEMRAALGDLPPAAADNTLKIAEMCNVELDFSAEHLPHFETPDDLSADEALRTLATEGLQRRYGGTHTDEHAARLDRELTVIAEKGYSSYFLIVNDLVARARSLGIPAAPRGSGVATLLGYVLGIADIDPMRYGLLFERFTDPQRTEAPDIDIDICQEGRGEILKYVREKYGQVAQIITYGTLKARAVLRDVGRVMGLPLADVDAVCKLVPEGPKVTLAGALDAEPELRKVYDADERVREMIDAGMKLEGLNRHSGIHAAGVVIADEPLETIVPLCKQADSDEAITQWDGPTCDKIGLMKMDFLGLRTLTILQRCRDLVRGRTGEDIDPETLPLDDPEVYRLFCEGRTDGIFQFESEGMKSVLIQMQPQRIEDLIAANAMYRPGPMQLIDSYCARKHGREEVPSVHPLVDDLLAETYGIMTYQEQVMQVLNRLGKLPLNRALTLIKAISKKKQSIIAAEKPNFIAGAGENGIDDAEAERLFELILRFAGYGFNKAHSTRYAIVAYQTAYFKAHWPREFLAATLTFESGDTDKVVRYMAAAERMGVTVAPPDVNACDRDFTVDGEQVRFGLAAVKGVGAKAVDAIIAARDEAGRFRDLYHFCENVDLRIVNRTAIDALIRCGAFDALGASRAQMVAALDRAVQLGQNAAADRRSGQMNLFGAAPAESAAPRFPDVEPWSEAQLLRAEKDTLGFYVTSHPLVKYAREMSMLAMPPNVTIAKLAQSQAENVAVSIGVMIAGVRRTVTRAKQERMAVLTVEDVTDACEAVVFPRLYEQCAELLTPERIVFLIGRADRRRERLNLVVEEILPIETALERLTGEVILRMPADASPAASGDEDKTPIAAVAEAIQAHRGNCPVSITLRPRCRADTRATIRLDDAWSVQPSRELLTALGDILGDADLVRLKPRNVNGNGGNGNGRKGAPRRRAPRQAPLVPPPARDAEAARTPASEAVTRFD